MMDKEILEIPDNFFIKDNYNPRIIPEYFHDVDLDRSGITHQPHVYPFVEYLSKRFGCTNIIDIGCGGAEKLIKLYPKFQITGIDYGDNIKLCQKKYDFGMWIEWNLEQNDYIDLSKEILSNSAIVCADVIEHLINPSYFFRNLKKFLNFSPICVISTPERDLVHGINHTGPPQNPYHVREWNMAELSKLIISCGFNLSFMGLTVNNDHDYEKKTIIAIIEKNIDES